MDGPEAAMLEFDEDRPSITGRKISSNIPPTEAGYEQSQPYLKWVLAAIVLPLVLFLLFVYLTR